MNRFKASAIHLFGSACVIGVFFLLVRQVWYPGQLFSAAAGAELLRLLICVDVILGPLITLIIFDTKKKKLRQDMFIVLFCQLCFLVYGFWSIFSVRPVYFALVGDQFYMVRANEIDSVDQNRAKNALFRQLPITGPEFVGTIEPDDQKIKNDLVFSSLAGMGLQNLPQYFVPFAQVQPQVRAVAKTSQQFKTITSETRLRLKNYELAHPTSAVAFVPLVFKAGQLFVVVKAGNGEVIEIIK
ncbi:TfpX/TfpZ family type IV pilin accessory protein [Sapientia aquatica]|uniref:Pilus assembly protein n=1 Tax=Sapientia aquatica TaxID=1549640 RepID=A0A4R5W5J9_9BURK|nr:TfpX/TfpZ family type IV pilin accessory protein [Sapientia aquatica]TDK68043.1 hypothetical protein E2I14_00340 [Sapientia aquatica]